MGGRACAGTIAAWRNSPAGGPRARGRLTVPSRDGSDASPASEDGPAAGWHARDGEDVLRALGSAASGLSDRAARERLASHGPNRLPQASGPSAAALLAGQIRSPFMYALVAAAALAAAFGELADATVVLAVVVLNALIGFVQEYRAGRAIAALAELVAEPALVRRDGAWIELPAELVVPGDVLSVGQGDRVTADVRLLSAERLRAQESVLTGESAPVDKHPRAVPRAAVVADRHSILHAGTVVAAGTGLGVAVATGPDTEVGRISALLDAVDPLQTPLTRELDRLGRTVTAVIGGAALLIGARGGGARVPGRRRRAGGHQPRRRRGAGGAAGGRHDRARRRGAAHGAPPRDRPPSPRRRDARLHHGRGVGQDRHPDVQPDDGPGIVDARGRGSGRSLLLASVLCNDATPGRGEAEALGDPTEIALLDHAAAAGVDAAAAQRRAPRLDTVPFDAGRKLMATLHAGPDGDADDLRQGGAGGGVAAVPSPEHDRRGGRAGRAPRRCRPARPRAGAAPRGGARPAPRPPAARPGGDDRPTARSRLGAVADSQGAGVG